MNDVAANPADPYLREGQTFPVLPEALVQRMARFGEEETLPCGSYAFRRGERSVDFFLVLSGAIDILEHDEKEGERSVHLHRANQFTGELDLFNDRKILVSGRAAGDTRVVRIKRPQFRAMITAEPDIGEIIMRAFILRRVGLLQHEQGGVTLIGPGHGADTVRLNSFLTRNGYPHHTIDTDQDEDAAGFLECFDLSPADLPVVIADGAPIKNPSNAELADLLGVSVSVDPDHVFDVAVVGAGPAGLAAAVYGASEGLDTIVIEGTAPGGQAATSSKIENYLGFPTGISGQALAGRAQTQAQKFGAKLAVSRCVTRLECDGEHFLLYRDDQSTVRARTVIAATGARYRRIEPEGIERFEGAGIQYAATAMEATLCSGAEVVVVGGGNSAGQAAIFLSRHTKHVHLLVRSEGLAATMSSYLIDRIEASDDITLHPYCSITKVGGGDSLEWLEWWDESQRGTVRQDVAAIFVMIGAAPNSEWLGGCAELDEKGFVVTGQHGSNPFMTSRPGLFAVGDLRSGSVKRVASGVGEGSVVIQFVHRWLEERRAAREERAKEAA